MSQHINNPSDPTFPDETPRPVEANQETPIESQERKLDEKNKNSTRESQQAAASSAKSITDIQQERKAGTQDDEDQARSEGPYGVQEEVEK